MNLNTTDNLINKFWIWFRQNELAYRKIFDESQTDLIDDVLNKLIEIQKGLAVEFEKVKESYLMTISADGVEENFDIVQKIIDNAPIVDNWKFVAFRQPYDKETLLEFVLTVHGHALDPKQIMFLPIEDEGKLYFQIFSPEITDESKSKIGYGCLMLLDNIIGEYACVKKVNGYEYYNLSEAKDFENELLPLIDARQFLDEYYEENI